MDKKLYPLVQLDKESQARVPQVSQTELTWNIQTPGLEQRNMESALSISDNVPRRKE